MCAEQQATRSQRHWTAGAPARSGPQRPAVGSQQPERPGTAAVHLQAARLLPPEAEP